MMIQILYPHLCNKQRERSKVYTFLKTEGKEISKGYFLNILLQSINACCLNDTKCQQKLIRAAIFFHFMDPVELIFFFLQLVKKLL